MLAKRFMQEFLGAEAEQHLANIDSTAKALAQHNWPGNVRELRNLVEIACHSVQKPIDLASYLYLGSALPRSTDRVNSERPFKVVKQELIQEFELEYITDLLKRHDGNVTQASKQAGIERAYLQRLVRKYGLREQSEPAEN